MADDFDIDKFLNESFSKIEQKLDKKNTTKKLDKVLKKHNKDDDERKSKCTTLSAKFNIHNFNFDKVIDNRILQEMGIQSDRNKPSNTNKKSTASTVNTEQLLKPLFPSDKVFEKEFQNSDKNFILDRYVGNASAQKKKGTINADENYNVNIKRTNQHLKRNKYKKVKESHLIKQLKQDETLTYETLIPMNSLWKQYIISLLNKTTQPDTIYSKMLKADLHGAIIEVRDSKNKNQIGIKGLNLLETRRTFNIITEDNKIKTILKKGSMFNIDLPYTEKNFTVKIMGDNFMFKAVERTKAKFKNKYHLD